MCRVIGFGWEETLEMRMRLFDGHPLGTESDAPRHTIDVRVHREGGFSQGKAEDDCSCFRTDAIESRQPGTRFLDRFISKK